MRPSWRSSPLFAITPQRAYRIDYEQIIGLDASLFANLAVSPGNHLISPWRQTLFRRPHVPLCNHFPRRWRCRASALIMPPGIALALPLAIARGVARVLLAPPAPVIRVACRPAFLRPALVLPIVRIGLALGFLPRPLPRSLAPALRAVPLFRRLGSWPERPSTAHTSTFLQHHRFSPLSRLNLQRWTLFRRLSLGGSEMLAAHQPQPGWVRILSRGWVKSD